MTAQDGAREEILIVGGGLVGSLASIYLQRRGFDVTIYERSPDMRQIAATADAGGRSINLVVASRGVRALQAVGLWDGARELSVPVTGRMVHSVNGELSYQPYGRDDSECNYSISRAGLNRFLITAAEERGVRFVFSRRLMDADLEAGRLEFSDESSSARETVTAANLVVGADGAASAVRGAFRGRPGFEESMELLEHGYKELTIPAADGGSSRIDGNVLHVWPRGDMMLMALPDLEGSFTVTLYLPQRGEESIDSLDTEPKVVELFEKQFPDAIPLIPDFARMFLQNPAGELGTVRCRPWHIDDDVFLIGDAAHAIVPFFGQGMNAGFEDCRILDEILDKHGHGDWSGALREYTDTRKPDADAIADMALENFVEMRDHVGDPKFLLRKQVEHALEEKLPLEYRSRYSMVMYGSHIPYGVARNVGEIQRGILDELCAGLQSASELDWDRARKLIHEKLTPYLEVCGAHLDY
jgi:kynurenine 3-monooxygenase